MAANVIENTPTDPQVMSSITADGFTVESNFETPAELKASLGIEETPPADNGAKAGAAVADGDSSTGLSRETHASRRNRREDPRTAVETAVAKQREAERLATEAADKNAALAAEIEELKKPKPAPVAPVPVVTTQTPPPVAAAPAPVTDAAYKRYQAMADAPRLFAADGTTPNFQSVEDYNFAVGHFIAQKIAQENFQRVEMAERARPFRDRVAAETAADPTFAERYASTPMDRRLIPYLLSHQKGTDVMVYLANNTDIAQRLATLQPDLNTDLPSAAQIETIGEIVATLKLQNAAAPTTTASARPAISTAKPVTKRVTGVPLAATDEPPGDESSEAEHEAYWGTRRREIRSARRHR